MYRNKICGAFSSFAGICWTEDVLIHSLATNWDVDHSYNIESSSDSKNSKSKWLKKSKD